MAHYRIKAVSRMLGVRPELLRMWEKRYHLFKPQRAGNRYREFDDEDVQLLRYICQQIDQGRAIGELAAEGRETLLRQSAIAEAHTPAVQPDHAILIDALLEAAQRLDKSRLEAKLAEGAALYSFATLLTAVVTPWMHRVGELWTVGQLPVASERLATVVLTQRLLTMLQATVPSAPAPVLLCACPTGERHELGLLTFAYIMQQAGWHVCYLGADLPIHELLYACQHLHPALVALSLTYAADQQSCRQMVQEIDTLFAGTFPIWIGGQAMARYYHLLHPHWSQLMPSLHAACTQSLWQVSDSAGFARVQPEVALVKVAGQQ
jgi:DNA-binding transcriptional MerR regulator/methylmalonyl-CoA mutase cobalamin-binding subunit